jgi:hypothetical protein
LLVARGEAAPAAPLLAEALDIRRATLPPGHWRVGETEAALGLCLLALEQPAEAAEHLRAAGAALVGRRGSTGLAAEVEAALARLPDGEGAGDSMLVVHP